MGGMRDTAGLGLGLGLGPSLFFQAPRMYNPLRIRISLLSRVVTQSYSPQRAEVNLLVKVVKVSVCVSLLDSIR
jgi:hypothetical protein